MITTVATTAIAAVTATIPITMFLPVSCRLVAFAGVASATQRTTIRNARPRVFCVICRPSCELDNDANWECLALLDPILLQNFATALDSTLFRPLAGTISLGFDFLG